MFAIVAALLFTGCAAGDERFAAESPAGFLWGLWHGCISFFTLIGGIWSDTVHVYEVRNTGGWYDFGFLLGVAMMWGGGHKGSQHAWGKSKDPAVQKTNEEEWAEVANKVEAKIKRRLREWADAEPEENWSDVEHRVEAKVRQVIGDWADKE
jgi:hypothetical protein